MAGIVSELFSDNDESESEKVSKNVIESDATTFGKKKGKKSTLSSSEKKKTTSIADIFVDAFFDKEKSQKKDTSLATKVSSKFGGDTPASESRKTVGKGKKPKSKGLLGKLKEGAGGAAGGIAAAAAALALLVGVGPIPGVLQNLANIEWSSIGKAFIILGGLVIVGKFMEEGSKGILIAAAALAILVGVGPIPGVLQNMAEIEWGMIAKGFVILGGLAIVGKLMKKGSFGILIAAAALAILVGVGPIPGVLQNMADIEWGTVAKALIILGGIALAGKFMKSGAVGLILGAAALTLMVHGALIPLQDIEWSTIGKAIVGILALGAVAALAGLVAGPIALGALALGLLGLALIPISYSLMQFQELEWSTLGKAFVGLLVLGAVGAILGIVSPFIILGAIALGLLGLALIPLAYGISLIVPGFESFMPMIEKLSKIDAMQMLLLGPALLGISAGLVALAAGDLVGKVLDTFGKLFGGEGPLDKLIKLGNVAEPILKLGDSLDSLGEIDLDDLKISGDPEVAVDGVDMITNAVYRLLNAQQKAVGNFKQMFSGPPSSGPSIFDKLFGLGKSKKEKSKEGGASGDVKTCCCDYKAERSGDSEDEKLRSEIIKEFNEIPEEQDSGSVFLPGFMSKLMGAPSKVASPNESSRGPSGVVSPEFSRPEAVDVPTPGKKDPFKKITQVVEALQVQVQTLAGYSRLTSDNTGKTVEAIKNIKIGNSSAAAPAQSAPQESSTTPESIVNSRTDYALSPYSLNVSSA